MGNRALILYADGLSVLSPGIPPGRPGQAITAGQTILLSLLWLERCRPGSTNQSQDAPGGPTPWRKNKIRGPESALRRLYQRGDCCDCCLPPAHTARQAAG